MKRKSWKWIQSGRNKYLIVTVLMGLLLSGLFGCGKTEEYVMTLQEVQETTDRQMQDEETQSQEEQTAETQKQEDQAQQMQSADRIYVDVDGAVKVPGVYQLAADARVFEAIALAGGLSEDACTNALNQAQSLTDGQKLYIPTNEEWENGSFAGNDTEDALTNTLLSQRIEADDGLININTADAAKLCELPGVGETRAQAIIQYRQEHGDFSNIEEIQNVSGIKSGLFAKIKDLIKVQ